MLSKLALLGLTIAVAVSITAIGCNSGSTIEPTPTATQPSTQNPTETPTQTPIKTATQTAEPTATGDLSEAASATNLDFTIEVVDEDNNTLSYRYRARNLGTDSLDFRLDATSDQTDTACIVKGSSHEGWIYTGSQWIEFTAMYENFDDFWSLFYSGFNEYYQYLSEEWPETKEWTYTIPEKGTVTYSNIHINTSLPDSIFQPN